MPRIIARAATKKRARRVIASIIGYPRCPMTAPGVVLRQSRFLTFDGAVSVVTAHQRPDRFRQLQADLGEAKRIARGAGLPYPAASFGEDRVAQESSGLHRLPAI